MTFSQVKSQSASDESAKKVPNGVIHIISLGGGVQSSTMALMAAHGDLTPMPEYAIFADTQNEPESVYSWLEWLDERLPFPIVRITKGCLRDAVLTVRTSRKGNSYTNSNVPAFLKTSGLRKEGKQMRQCTRDFKIDIILREVRKLAAPSIRQWKSSNKSLPIPVIQWIGISRDEIFRIKPSRLPYISHRWPLIELGMTRWKCLDWMKDKGYPPPPRSACVFCPYHSDAEWRRLRDQEPSEFKKAVKFEQEYQIALSRIERRQAVPFLHRSLLPLDQVDFSTDEDHGQQVMFGNECEGMCGV
ncbi:MAG: hypothetical protein DMF38_12480 [Verrucomicrobia bacterium]|nr:MAG: hypothetical protein DMF38_12480 [Verrucomicrobiota bacterium]